jgi:hypothetical protein
MSVAGGELLDSPLSRQVTRIFRLGRWRWPVRRQLHKEKTMSDITTNGGSATTAAEPPLPSSTPPGGAKSKLALSAFVLGIVALVCAVIPALTTMGVLAGLAAVVLGIVALKKKVAPKRRSVLGLSFGAVALIIAMSVSAAASGGNNPAEPAAQKQDTTVTQPTNSPSPASTPSATPAPTSTPTATPTPTKEPEPPAPAVPANKAYKGSGDSIVKVELPDGADQVAVATISHKGSSNFAVWALDSNMEQQDLMVNRIGNYQGTVLFNLNGNDTTSLEVTADGAWTITVRSVLSLRQFKGAAATGTGDDVIIYQGEAGAAALTHNGESNFAVWSYGDNTDLVVNQIGTYKGTVRWSAGPSVIAVSADGKWSITVS